MSTTTPTIDPFVLDTIRNRGGKWAVYENSEIGHPNAGHLQFLAYGPGKTYLFAPQRMPDTKDQINWRYLLVGYVNLETGEIVRTKDLPHPVPAIEGWAVGEPVVLDDQIQGGHLVLYKRKDRKPGDRQTTAFMTVHPDGGLLRSCIGNDSYKPMAYPGTLLKEWLKTGRITQADHDRGAVALKRFEEE